MSLLGPVTDADRRRWQRNGARALVDLLNAAESAALPPITWQLGTTSRLVGQCLADDDAERRQAFEAWAAFLEGQTTRTPTPGREFLRTERRSWGDNLTVDVIVTARITLESGSGDPT